MSQQVSLKQVEKRMYQAAFKDGLIEIFIGSFILIFAIAPLLSTRLGDFWSSFIFLPFWALVGFILKYIRKTVVVPRIGAVQFGSWRKKRLKFFTLLMVGFNLAALVLGFITFTGFERIAPLAIPIRFSVIILAGFSLAAALLQQPRFYLYGLMIAAAPVAGEYLYQNFGAGHHGFPISFGLCAAVLFCAGAALLIRVIISHPVDFNPLPETEESL